MNADPAGGGDLFAETGDDGDSDGDAPDGDAPDGWPPGPGAEETDAEVPALLEGVRIDRAVAMVTGLSRAAAAALVTGGRVRLDGVAVTTRSVAVRGGQRLSVALPEVAALPVPDPSVAFTVVHEDPDLVVVDKPAGLVVHPGAGRTTGTLVHGLLSRYPDLADLGARGVCDPQRPGIVHRLDRETSGLLAVARSEGAYRSLVAQLSARQVGRTYLALVSGEVSGERGVVDAPVGRSERAPTKMAISAGGREARTSYRVLERFGDPAPATLLSVALETGRTHQIRVHLAAIGHPVVGDRRYGPGDHRLAGLLPGDRFFLHAAELTLAHPVSHQVRTWTAPVPADLAAVLEALRRPGGPR